MDIKFQTIGHISSPYQSTEDIPFQSVCNQNQEGVIVLLEEYADGLEGLKAGDNIEVVFYFHQSKGYSLRQVPSYTSEEKGVFSIRSPRRPNPIGISIVKIKNIGSNRIVFSGVDMLDGTPVLDIKPFVKELVPSGEVVSKEVIMQKFRKE